MRSCCLYSSDGWYIAPFQGTFSRLKRAWHATNHDHLTLCRITVIEKEARNPCCYIYIRKRLRISIKFTWCSSSKPLYRLMSSIYIKFNRERKRLELIPQGLWDAACVHTHPKAYWCRTKQPLWSATFIRALTPAPSQNSRKKSRRESPSSSVMIQQMLAESRIQNI